MTKIYYSNSECGFYNEEVHKNNLPTDSIEISQHDYNLLFDGQAKGKVISFNKEGRPYLKDPQIVVNVQTDISMTRFQLSLLKSGYLDDVEAAISTMSREAQILWAKSPTIERNDILVAALSSLLNLSDADVDELFAAASKF